MAIYAREDLNNDDVERIIMALDTDWKINPDINERVANRALVDRLRKSANVVIYTKKQRD